MSKSNTSRAALVIDDDDSVNEFVKAVLESSGFYVYTAPNGGIGEAILRDHPEIMLIVTDIVMPTEDGIELIFKIRNNPEIQKNRPILIAISGGGLIDSETYLEDAKLLGANAVLAKPFTDVDLKKTLHQLGVQ